MQKNLFEKWDKEDKRDLAKIERARKRFERADTKAEKKELKQYEKELNRGLGLW